MISVENAREIIRENTGTIPPQQLPLDLAAGLVLAEDLYAATDIPAFPQSAMDGYALSFAGWQPGVTLQLSGEIAAGSSLEVSLAGGQAARIFTGAPLPQGTDTVVIQEKTSAAGNDLLVLDDKLKKGSNVRPRGSEIRAGALALPAGTLLTPAATGFLAGIGIGAVPVYPRPSVTIIITGNELAPPGIPLQYGQVYDANSFLLGSALKQLHITGITTIYIPDDRAKLERALEQALQQTDLILLSGGVSAGDYDFVLPAAAACGVTTLFHKVKQRPGKPLFFGSKAAKLVFGLPGNPSSALTCFYEYVMPATGWLCGRNMEMPSLTVPLQKPVQKPAGLTCFLKGFYDGTSVAVLHGQESYRLASYARANCLLQLPETPAQLEAGTMVEIHLLPF